MNYDVRIPFQKNIDNLPSEPSSRMAEKILEVEEDKRYYLPGEQLTTKELLRLAAVKLEKYKNKMNKK